jgi:sec-independent protein translocase protein TatA
MGGFSLIHWLVLGVIILLLFGGNRFSAMMGDVAKGLKGFKQGLADDPPAPLPSAEASRLEQEEGGSAPHPVRPASGVPSSDEHR